MQRQVTNNKSNNLLGINRDVLAVIIMTSGSVFLTLGFIFTNQNKFHPTITGIIRGFSALFISYFIARWKNINLTFPSTHNFKWQIIRNSIMTLQGLVYSWSQFYLPLPIAVTLYSTNPIFVALWDYWVFGVSMNPKQKGWFCLAFLGVILTANCSYLQKMIFTQKQVKGDKYISSDPIVQLLVGLTFAIVQFVHGIGMIATKKLINTDTIQLTYFVGVLLLLVNAVLMPTAIENENYYWPTLWQFLKGILFSGVLLTCGMLCINGAMTISHRYGLVMPFQFSAIIVGYFMSILRYGEDVNWVGISGTAAIVVGVIFLLKYKED